MTTSKNRLRLDYKDLPELKAALGGLQPGDSCMVEFKLMVVKNDDNGLDGDIESVEYESTDEEAGENEKSASATPSSDEPIMAVISKRNAAKKPAKNDAPVAEETDTEE